MKIPKAFWRKGKAKSHIYVELQVDRTAKIMLKNKIKIGGLIHPEFTT